MLFRAKTQYLEPILFPEGTWRFLELKFWDLTLDQILFSSISDIKNLQKVGLDLTTCKLGFHFYHSKLCLIQNGHVYLNCMKQKIPELSLLWFNFMLAWDTLVQLPISRRHFGGTSHQREILWFNFTLAWDTLVQLHISMRHLGSTSH